MISLADIDETYLQSLVDNEVEENVRLDFKLEAYETSYKNAINQSKSNQKKGGWKSELCKDICAFANRSGGRIFLGVGDDKSNATSVVGIDIPNTEGFEQQYRNIIHEKIEPHIQHIEFRFVKLTEDVNKYVVVIQVNRSFRYPHREKYENHFYIRHGQDNKPMDMDEIRSAFNLSETYIERVRNFRAERIELLSFRDEDGNPHDDLPVALFEYPYLVMHCIPLNFSNIGASIDLSSFNFRNRPGWVHDSKYLSLNYGYGNFEGYIAPVGSVGREYQNYCQVFRHGTVEFVNQLFLHRNHSHSSVGIIDPSEFSTTLVKFIREILDVQNNRKVQLPISIMISMVAVKGLKVANTKKIPLSRGEKGKIRKKNILFPEVILSDYVSNLEATLQPIFDVIQNMTGDIMVKSD